MLRRSVLIIVTLLITFLAVQSQQPVPNSKLSQAEIDHIIKGFTTKETEFRNKLNNYAFVRDADIMVLGSNGLGKQITGRYHRISHLTFDDSGARTEKILSFPPPVPDYMNSVVTKEDLYDLSYVNPFAVEASKIGEYNFTYVGKEHIDELDLYVFDVAPKVAPDAKKTKERYFQGRVWVDSQDLQIVKTMGKALPETDTNKFPVCTTYRENIDGKYWFPTFTYAAPQTLEYPNSRMTIAMTVRYRDFREFKGKVVDIKEVPDEAIPTEKPTPKPKP